MILVAVITNHEIVNGDQIGMISGSRKLKANENGNTYVSILSFIMKDFSMLDKKAMTDKKFYVNSAFFCRASNLPVEVSHCGYQVLELGLRSGAGARAPIRMKPQEEVLRVMVIGSGRARGPLRSASADFRASVDWRSSNPLRVSKNRNRKTGLQSPLPSLIGIYPPGVFGFKKPPKPYFGQLKKV